MDERYHKIINDRQLVSVMNKTKWRELCHDFEKLHSLNISVRYKLISSEETLGFSSVWWDEILEESPGIEWLEFNPIVFEHRGLLVEDKKTERIDEILTVLKKHRIKYSMQGPNFRVWGYISQEESPEFV